MLLQGGQNSVVDVLSDSVVLPIANIAEKVKKKSQGVSNPMKYVRLKFNPISLDKLLDKLIGVDVIGPDSGLLLSKVLSTALESSFSRNDSTITIPTKVLSKILKLSKAIKPSSGVETKHDRKPRPQIRSMQNHPRLFVMLLLLYWKKLSPHVPKVWVWGLHQGPRSILELFWAWNLTKKTFWVSEHMFCAPIEPIYVECLECFVATELKVYVFY